MMFRLAKREQAPMPKAGATPEGSIRTPRPDCAIWNDIARVLGTKPEQSK